jgi:hypothetical protein
MLQRMPKTPRGNSLSVVHVPLGWIVSEYPVDNNCSLSIRKPAIKSEPGLGLYGGSRHKEE